MKSTIKLTPTSIAFFYALCGSFWIFFSDKVVESLTGDISIVTNPQTIKGLFFVLITSLLLYFLVRKNNRRIIAADQDMLEQERNYRILFDRNPSPMWVYDLESLQILNANEAATKAYGYTLEEFTSMNIKDLNVSDDLDKLINSLHDFRQNGTDFYTSDEWRHVRKDKSIMPVQIASQSIVYNNRNARIVMAQDITQRKKVEEDLLVSLNELDTFVYRASHDLRGPLARLLGMCKIAPMEVRSEGAATYYNMLRQVAEEMDRTLAKLLLLNNLKKRMVEFTKLNFNELLYSVAYQLHLANNPEITFTADLPEDLEIYSDEYMLKLILVNVLENAVKYRNTRPDYLSMIHVTAYYEEGVLYVRVSDNGIGIDREAQAKIFNMFYRGTNLSKGSGVGLYSAKIAALKLGGDIKLLHSEYHKTEFEIAIPDKKRVTAEETTPFMI